ncbi:MAG: Integral membrane protein [Candidatus Carbobacillus altaicus]|uniref:Integral membrane protein n=1 Tax=Candidatus Carbonibacillus altaicus TaxID=2163959 RepID=A0A2R6XXD7_9BACL|nr:MAG: Integral membrane protein [Candidatus Carbobacillus altaicus]
MTHSVFKKEIPGIHVLRLLAALSIILIHVTSGQAGQGQGAFWWNQFARYASFSFVVISGYVLALSQLRRPVSWRYFYERRFTRVLIPYITWSMIYILYQYRGEWMGLNFDSIIRLFIDVLPQALWTGTAFVHLYFVLVVVQLYFFFPFIFRLSKSHPSYILVLSFLISIGMDMLIEWHARGWIVLPSLGIAYTTLFPAWLFAFVLGVHMAIYTERWHVFLGHPIYSRLLFILWPWMFAWLVVDSMLYETHAISVKTSALFYGLISFLVLYRLLVVTGNKNTWWDRLTRHPLWVKGASRSFLIYLVHPLVLNATVRGSVKLEIPQIFYGWGLVLLYSLTVSGTFLLILIIERLPFSRWLGGKR